MSGVAPNLRGIQNRNGVGRWCTGSSELNNAFLGLLRLRWWHAPSNVQTDVVVMLYLTLPEMGLQQKWNTTEPAAPRSVAT
jgi:hypothetical protein